MSPDPPPAGLIHDLGFRHYDGPRVGPAAVARVLAVETLRGAYGLGRSTRSKIMPMLLLAIAVVPALVVAVIATVLDQDELPLRYVDYPLVLELVAVLFVASQAPAAVSRDLRSRVVSLYFSRPISRTQYVQAKYVAMVGAVCALLGLPLLVLYAGALLAGMPPGRETVGLLQGLVLASMLAVVLSGISLVLASVTPRRGLGVAAVVVTLVLLGSVQGALQAVGQEQGRAGLAAWSRLVAPGSTVEGVGSWWWESLTVNDLPRPSAVLGLSCLGALVVVAVAAYLLLLVRYRRVSVS